MKGVAYITVLAVVSLESLIAEHRGIEQIFNRWIDVNSSYFQHTFRDVDIATMAQDLDAERRKLFNERFFAYHDKINSFGKFFVKTGTHPSLAMTLQENNEFPLVAKRELTTIFKLLQNNIAGFVAYLKKCGFESEELNKKEAATYFNDVIEQHKGLMSVLFARADSVLENEYLFTVANHFFEFCFLSPTWKTFNVLLRTSQDYPIVRLLYSTIWYNLAGNGWKEWHYNTLQALQKKCLQPGTYVTYIAGGSDLYQLLNHEIYTINIIDPMLPSQPQYYSEGWAWLIRGNGDDGGINDELTVNTSHKKLVLKRVAYQEHGSFTATLSTNEVKEIPQSVTTWNVYDQEAGQKLGAVTFDRRFCRQSDFNHKPGQFLLMSFNELYFATTTEPDNWGINPELFPKDFTLFVKQLRRPVTKEIVNHMRQADRSSFSFIKLGTSVT